LSERVRIVTHRGHLILFVDHSDQAPEGILELHPLLSKTLIEHRLKLVCQDLSGSRSDERVKQSTREALTQSRAALGRVHSAVIGVGPFRKLLGNALLKDHYYASNREEAMDWLVKQAER